MFVQVYLGEVAGRRGGWPSLFALLDVFQVYLGGEADPVCLHCWTFFRFIWVGRLAQSVCTAGRFSGLFGRGGWPSLSALLDVFQVYLGGEAGPVCLHCWTFFRFIWAGRLAQSVCTAGRFSGLFGRGGWPSLSALLDVFQVYLGGEAGPVCLHCWTFFRFIWVGRLAQSVCTAGRFSGLFGRGGWPSLSALLDVFQVYLGGEAGPVCLHCWTFFRFIWVGRLAQSVCTAGRFSGLFGRGGWPSLSTLLDV